MLISTIEFKLYCTFKKFTVQAHDTYSWLHLKLHFKNNIVFYYFNINIKIFLIFVN